ncbi:hypothetical protein [Crocosphaera sp.]|uniref:hypothetical protein n=1 Tax=Crocosphaera sp. TaxID=2729996 RepID=UPI00260F3E89|nr:hypothetical protein [Crocosphaera sp.]MDJ0578868.1 hypothetical protein [Crocosphaera sp.]
MDLIQAAPIILCRIFQCFGSAMVMIMVDAIVAMVGWVRRGINCNEKIINFYLSRNPPF